jgi:hypothetical protein
MEKTLCQWFTEFSVSVITIILLGKAWGFATRFINKKRYVRILESDIGSLKSEDCIAKHLDDKIYTFSGNDDKYAKVILLKDGNLSNSLCIPLKVGATYYVSLQRFSNDFNFKKDDLCLVSNYRFKIEKE